MTIKVDPKKLLDGGAHFGHQAKRWNPKMEEYIFTQEKGVHIFDLIQTQKALEEALDMIEKISKEGKDFILVGTKKQVKEKVAEVAKDCGFFYVNERWLGGTLTNFDQVKKSLKKLSDMKAQKEAGEFKVYTKKERVLLDREIERLERFFAGLSGLEKKPDLMLVIDVKKEKGACKEAKRLGVTTIGIVDSNSDPDMVDLVIPMNDDAVKALHYLIELVGEAYKKGKSKVKKTKKESKE